MIPKRIKVYTRQQYNKDQTFKKMGKIRLVIFLTLLSFSTLVISCHKSPGAICNDGHRSYSTGRGTGSWHGGVNHYIDTDEISIPKTVGLIVVIIIVGRVFIGNKSKK